MSISLLLLSFSAQAFETSDASGDEAYIFSGLHTGFGSVDEDLFVLVNVEQGFVRGDFELVLSGPLRFQVRDNEPYGKSVLRKEDWDNPSDFARIVRTMSFEKELKDGLVDLHLGEVNGAHMGHGTVVAHYYNSTDMDHYHGGLELKVDVAGNGVSFMMNDVVAPSIFATSGFISPFSWFFDSPVARRFEMSGLVVADSGVASKVDDEAEQHILVGGGALSFELIDGEKAQLVTHIDMMASDGSGGFHAGLASSFLLSGSKGIVLNAQAEYRLMGNDYYPALFNPFYDYNRRFYDVDPGSGERRTFSDHLRFGDDSSKKFHGFAVDLGLLAGDMLKLGIRYDNAGSDRPHWLLFRLELSPRETISARVFVGGQDIDGGADLFSDETLLGFSFYSKIKGPLGVFAEFSRKYRRESAEQVDVANEIFGGVTLVVSY